jgi:hypothetical protein
MTSVDNPDFADAWLRQIDWCDANGSPFTARVLEAALADWRTGGALRELLPAWAGDPWKDALALRVAGALHAMALDGSEAELAALYPPQRDRFDPVAGPAAVSAALRRQAARVADYLRSAPQTNEVNRSAVLLGGFAMVATLTGLPLATLEIGASAGLNQLWHRCRHELGTRAWGDAASPLRLHCDWQGTPPTLPRHIEVASQAACDRAPIDLAAPGAALKLMSYVWPDQHERLERLRAAIAAARAFGVHVEATDALDWVRRELATPRRGVATVLYHSIVWQYLPQPTRGALRAEIEAAGVRASASAPFAWLTYEAVNEAADCQLTLTLWPGGQARVLADVHPHARWARWTQ